jgi:hypothetical protein
VCRQSAQSSRQKSRSAYGCKTRKAEGSRTAGMRAKTEVGEVEKEGRYVHQGNNFHLGNTGLRSSNLSTKIISITHSVLLHQRRINPQMLIHRPHNPQRQNKERLRMGKHMYHPRSRSISPPDSAGSTHHTHNPHTSTQTASRNRCACLTASLKSQTNFAFLSCAFLHAGVGGGRACNRRGWRG